MKKTKTKTIQEQNNSKPLDIQKIEKQIQFNGPGPWKKHVEALLFFGINVPRMIYENKMMKGEIKELIEANKFHYHQSVWAHEQMIWWVETFPGNHEHTYPDKNVIINPLDIIFDVSIKN